jgi:hypothetical protein
MSLFSAWLNIRQRHTRQRQKDEASTRRHRPEELLRWSFQSGLRQIKPAAARAPSETWLEYNLEHK